MANSIPDITINTAWKNVYTASGIAVGTAIIVQNKSSNPINLYISASTPPSANIGYALKSLESVSVDAGESGCWVSIPSGSGMINVQVG